MVSPPPANWRFESRLPWPGVRGCRLWHHVTNGGNVDANANTNANANASDDDDDANNHDDGDGPSSPMRRRPSLAVPSAVRYEVEMCESTAGHIALVLLRRDAASTVPASPTAPADDATAAAASQLAIPRVLYVVDAVPPKRASSTPSSSAAATQSPLQRHMQAEPRWTMLASDARAHSFAAATSASSASAEGVATPSLVFSSMSPPQQQVDELALVEELFTTSRATKDACILAKPPLLCARFDCRLVAVQFSRRLDLSSTSSSSSSSTSPLRCVVAREDGMCYIWEWSGDLHTWSFLNRFCFLDNPNLKWTRPVMLFATAHSPAWGATSTTGNLTSDAVETTELAWWSVETKQEPKLFVRKIQFGIEKNTFRTEIRIGSAFVVPGRVRDVAALHRSTHGLWIVSQSDGVRLRSGATLHMLHLEWAAVWGGGGEVTSEAASRVCAHGVTGELLVLHGKSGRVVVVSPRTQPNHDPTLVSKPLLTLRPQDQDEAVQSLAVHRQLLLVLLASRVAVYSVVSGAPLVALSLPTIETPLTLWSSASTSDRAGASAVGLVGARGYWQLRPPSGHALATLHASSAGAAHALQVARPYGPTLAFDAASVALELLQSARALVGPTHTAAWDAAIQTHANPALLLATLSRSNGLLVLDDMAALVAALYRVTHEVLVTGRLSTALDKRDDTRVLRGLPFVTPASVESLPHLANWVLLATRALARLRGAVVHKGTRRARARTISSLSTFTEDDDDDVLNDPAAAAMPAVHRSGTSDETADEASASQLSRQLRPMTSLQFAAGSCATRHGAQWLAQLETLLRPTHAPPHALLFHAERALADFQVALSSFSKHMYFESMCRLYLLHAPAKLLAFVRAVAQYAPRLFSLSGYGATDARTHAERALMLMPPAPRLVERVRREALTLSKPASLPVVVARSGGGGSGGKKKPRASSTGDAASEGDRTPAKTTLLVYVDLLCLCGYTLEACRVLLDADLYDACVARLLLSPEVKEEKEAVVTAVFFALLEFCVASRSAADLESLLAHKPPHVDALLVLRALRQLLPLQMVRASTGAGNGSDVVSVGALRKVLLRLVREHTRSADSNTN